MNVYNMSMNSFDKWNALKQDIDLKDSKPKQYPKEGEVWMSAVGKNIGYEQNGSGEHFSRPMLVVKKFNNHMFWCVPLSTKQKDLDFYYNFIEPEENEVSAIIAQLKLVSVKRVQRKMYDLDKNMLNEIRLKLIHILS